jgi:hypothetical protein
LVGRSTVCLCASIVAISPAVRCHLRTSLAIRVAVVRCGDAGSTAAIVALAVSPVPARVSVVVWSGRTPRIIR